MASEEPPLSYSRVRITSMFLMALVKHMISWFSCAFNNIHSAFSLPSASFFPSFTFCQGNIGPLILSRVCACSVTSVLTLWSYERYPLGSSVQGILQAKVLEWVAMSSLGQALNLLSLHSGGFFTTEPPGKYILLRVGHYFSQTS